MLHHSTHQSLQYLATYMTQIKAMVQSHKTTSHSHHMTIMCEHHMTYAYVMVIHGLCLYQIKKNYRSAMQFHVTATTGTFGPLPVACMVREKLKRTHHP